MAAPKYPGRYRSLPTAVCVGVIAAIVCTTGAQAKAKGFEYGVAAGDVTSSSAILWAKADKSGTTYVQLVHNFRFGRCDEEHRTPR